MKVLLAKVALPAGPTEPISTSNQPLGRAVETTVRLREEVLVRLPDVPLMMTEKVPVSAAPPAARVSTLEPLVLLGLNDAVTPLGNPDADKLTLALKPF